VQGWRKILIVQLGRRQKLETRWFWQTTGKIVRKLRASSRRLIRKLGLPGPPRAHALPHVLFDFQHYSTLSYSSLGSYFSSSDSSINFMYPQLMGAPCKRHGLVLRCMKNSLSFGLDETHASEMCWIGSGPPSECNKRSNAGKDLQKKTLSVLLNHVCQLTYVPAAFVQV